MKKVLYLECAGGISGDMAVAALLDLGASEEHLRDVLGTLPVEDPYDIRISRVTKSGLDTCDFDVLLGEDQDPHDHDLAYLHGHEHRADSDGSLGETQQDGSHGTEHSHEHSHEHHHGYGVGHDHRSPQEIRQIFHGSRMSEGALAVADRIMMIIAKAEAKAHGVSLEKVHFHEVGAMDSILDVASFAICFDELQQKHQWEQVVVRNITEGQGTVRCQHGILPIPVPAVTNILMEHKIPLRITDVEGELVTPTGAAIAAAVATTRQLPEEMNILEVGLGAGKREYNTAGFLRILLLEAYNGE
jgi:uncharacterized protein (DUF111 family)